MNEDAQTPSPTSNFDRYFQFAEREKALYAAWEAAGLHRPESAKNQSAPVFNISMPPPNANGELHLGHSYGYSVMDILGRYHRMLGERVLLLPGKDHAGIQTQVVFEKKLTTEGVDLKKADPKDLSKQCYEFCIDRAQYMRNQEKILGLSADWSRELFTLDPRLTDIIYETFERMWKDGLVYRGTRIINWSVFSQTAISDVEVEYKEQTDGLWYLMYPLVEPVSDGEQFTLPNGNKVQIGAVGLFSATTRPETMLGDTALAVHPEDARYKKFIGKQVRVPLTNRTISVIADTRVDPAFGTGVIKVTPAHSFVDYDIGQDHKLPLLQVIGKDGKMTAEAGTEFAGLPTKNAREKVVERMNSEGLLLDTTSILHKVPIGERGKDIIEPLISEQWFINVDKEGNSLKKRALELVQSGKIKIYPERFRVLFEQWLENLRDWNISRQIWWGHQLPVWYKTVNGKEEIFVGRQGPTGDGWRQDTDVFDTWFSSGQWAYSTMGAHGMVDLNSATPESAFFPTNTMVMGRDILLFWACRMVLLTTYRLGTVPWKNIFFTGLIRDEHGQKMSKSKGNGIDPLEVIAKYGTDPLRLALVMGASAGNDLNLGEKKIEGYSKFINKLWNAGKLIEMKLGDQRDLGPAPKSITLDSSRWILAQLNQVSKNVTGKLNEFEIAIAADELYTFSWTVFCDWYLESMKVLMERGTTTQQAEVRWVAGTVFRRILTLLHPLIPFVTEELYQKLPFLKQGDFVAMEPWNASLPTVTADGTMARVLDIVTAIRSVKANVGLANSRSRVALADVVAGSEAALLIAELARVTFCNESEIPTAQALRKPFTGGVVVCEVENKEQYRKKLEKDIETTAKQIEMMERKLSGAFATQGKPEIVAAEREKLANAKKAAVELEREMGMFA